MVRILSSGAELQKLTQKRRRRNHLLEVVEHQQQESAGEESSQLESSSGSDPTSRSPRAVAIVSETSVRVDDRSQGDEGDAVSVVVRDRVAHGPRSVGLVAGAAGEWGEVVLTVPGGRPVPGQCLRAAASSIASGNPSSRMQIAATMAALAAVKANSGLAAVPGSRTIARPPLPPAVLPEHHARSTTVRRLDL